MSFYPSFRPSQRFNSKDIISYEESSTQSVIKLDMSSFIQRSNPTFNTPIYLTGDDAKINLNGKVQTVAYGDEDEAAIYESERKLTKIAFDNSTKTTISGLISLPDTVDLQGTTVLITDESIAISKIQNLTSTLTGIQTNLSQIISNDQDIVVLQSHDVIHSTSISDNLLLIQGHTLTLNDILTDVADVVKPNILQVEANIAANLSSIDTLKTDVVDLKELTSLHSNQILDLQSQDVVLAQNTTTLTEDVEAYKLSTNAAIVTVNEAIVSNDNDISILQTNSQSLFDLTATHSSHLDTLDLKTDTQKDRLDSIDVLNELHGDKISAIETVNLSQSGEISVLQGVQGSHGSRIVSNEGSINTHTSKLNEHEIALTTKQPMINNFNRLPVSYLGSGTVSDVMLSQLSDISTTSTIQSQLNAQSALIAQINGLQDIDLSQLNIDVDNLQSSNSVNESLLTTHTIDIAALKIKDTTLESSIATVQNNLTTIETDLSALIVTNSSDISSANSTIGFHTNDIAVLKTKDGELQTSIATVQSNLTTMGTNLSALIVTNSSDISSANSTIGFHTNDITSLKIKDSELQTSIENVQTNLSTLGGTVVNNKSSIDSNISDINETINIHGTSLTALSSSDELHDTRMNGLQAQDAILQTNIDLKQDLISFISKLDTSLIYDTSLNLSLNTIIDTIEVNIETLSSTKQNLISGSSLLDSNLIDFATSSLKYVDITSNLSAQLTVISNAISTLQNLQNGDIISFQTIEENFDTLEAAKLDKSVYNETIIPQITSINNAILTLQGLQNGDIISFQGIIQSITNLQNEKQGLITSTNKILSSNIERDDSLSYFDINSSLTGLLNTLQTNIDENEGTVYSSTTKLDGSFINLENTNLKHVDINSSLNTKLNSLDSSITTLNNFDVSQGGINSTIQSSLTNKQNVISLDNKINSSFIFRDDNLQYFDISSSLSSLLNTIQTNSNSNGGVVYDANNKLNSSFVNRNDNLIHFDINYALDNKLNTIDTSLITLSNYNSSQDIKNSNQLLINDELQTNINNVKTKIEKITSGLFESNILTYTYNEENIFMNQLIVNNVFELNLIIDTVMNGKNYIQKVIIDALEFKGYINTLKINGDEVEIKYKNGDESINLAPIAGYSMVSQILEMTYYNDIWFCISRLELFYNSVSNRTYDITDPVITLNGEAVIDVEINTEYIELGAYSSIDNVDGDITNGITIDSSAVNMSVKGSHNVYYYSTDEALNIGTRIRVVNVVDTTPPIIVLNGEPIISIDEGGIYVELGAVVNDNSLENLNFDISGSVNTSIPRDYTISYTATDSAGNSFTINRLIYVIEAPPVWTNSSFDVFNLLGFFSQILETQTETKFNISGNGVSAINGEYRVSVNSYKPGWGFNHLFRTDFDTANQKYYEFGVGTFGIRTGETLEQVRYNQHPYLNTNYRGATNNAVLFPYNSTFSHIVSGETYGGEALEIDFPFNFKLIRYNIQMDHRVENIVLSPYLLLDLLLCGSNDKITFTSIARLQSAPVSIWKYEDNVVNPVKYRFYKLIFIRIQGNRALLGRVKFYGDIYA